MKDQSTMAAKAESSDESTGVKLLSGINDQYGGVIVETIDPIDPASFLSLLTSSIAHWKLEGKKGVWIKLPIQQVNLVEPAVMNGFWYHHAEPTYLMLVNWIPPSPHTLPANASHRVGIGAFVLNQDREVLVVQEKSGYFQGTGVWKFPTGVVDEGENIYAAAVREVKEETGIDSEFVEVLAFSQSHKSFFEKSDLFFVCLLRALSFDIQKQEQELEAAQWMPFEEYVAQPFVQTKEFLKYNADICRAKMEGEYSGLSPVTMTSSSGEKSYLYLSRQ
ncbi:PREDICTED: nudix hydrolase 2-like [Fragaria vesca subsp. vesca]|uniref:nudix hydrolase 2-like n=1 Tax=Fragaria vesca subsp. vesca TaxID=101020 RepID=UPI0002C36517|nr:PREDICTED: nudix hydrolase 2-like [Fragaria vesca subsp. vesca]